MTTSTASAKADAACLKWAGITLLGVDALDYEKLDEARAFEAAGIMGFNSEFIGSSPDDFDDLQVPISADGSIPAHPLKIAIRRKLKIVLAFYHHCCRKANGPVNISLATKVMYDTFRTSIYDPTKPIIPWTAKLPNEDDDVTMWRRTIKPNRADFKIFKDDVYWTRSKESFVTTVESQGLAHLIDPAHKPSNAELDDIQPTEVALQDHARHHACSPSESHRHLPPWHERHSRHLERNL